MKKGKRVQYAGDLDRPIKYSNFDDVSKEILDRIFLLLDHFEIDRKDSSRWELLALALALRYVPGFQIAEKEERGRPKTWPEQRLARLAEAVDKIKKENPEHRTDLAACQHLMRHEVLWKTPANHRGGSNAWSRTLQNRASEGRKTIYYRLGFNHLTSLFLLSLTGTSDKNGSSLEALLKGLSASSGDHGNKIQ